MRFNDKIGSRILQRVEAKKGMAQAYKTMIILQDKKLY